jgi:uncharacterized protein with PIN domain
MNEQKEDMEDMQEKTDELCNECEPTFLAFLEQMAAHNLEQVRELNPRSVVCPKCGRVHEYTGPNTPKVTRSRAS